MKTIEIQNLKCSACSKTISNGLSKIEGIHDLNIQVEENEISFNSDSEKSTQVLISKLIKMGYPPVGEENTLTNKAKSYVSCAIGKMS